MKNRFIGIAVLPLVAILALGFIALPSQAQPLVSKASSHRTRAAGRQVTPVEVSLPSSVAILASEWIDVRKSSSITGNATVNGITPGPFPTGFALTVDGTVAGDVKAASVNIGKFASVVNVCRDTLTNGGGTISGTTGPYSTSGAPPCQGTPLLYNPLPPFNSATPGSTIVDVPTSGTQTIGPGRIGSITVGKNATLFISGGVVEASSVQMESGAKLLFQSASELRVAGRFNAVKSNQIGPASGSGINASNIVVYVEGLDTSSSAFDSAAVVGESSTAGANFYVPNGTFDLGKSASLTGAVVALRAIIETSSTLTVNSAFTNKPPTANPQTVLTNGATSVDIILTGVDPEKQDLGFSIVSPPNATVGSITAGPTLITPPAPPKRCSLSANACNVVADCPVVGETCDPTGVPAAPISSAVVTYTPAVPDATGQSAENSFTFQVADPGGLTGTAVVSINPYDNSPPPPPATAVTATNVTADTAANTPVGIGLTGGGPPGVSLTFRVTGLPAGSLLDSDGVAVESIRDLPGSALTYTPPPDSTSPDSFTFSVRNSATGASPCPAGSPATCATATVNISVTARYRLAPDLSASTNLNQPVQITLPGNPGGTGSGGGPLSIAGKAILPGADVAGGVADINDDNIGDSVDIPDLVSAGVDLPGSGSGSGGATDATGDSAQPAHNFKTFLFHLASSSRALRITPVGNLTNAGGTVGLDVLFANPGNVECFNCNPFRDISEGTLTSPGGTPSTWTLTGVTFGDGGTAAGSFDYDAATNTVSAFSISISGGNETAFPPLTLTDASDTVSVSSLSNLARDLVTTTATVDGTNITLEARFKPVLFQTGIPERTRLIFLLDTDQDAGTGCDPADGPPCGPEAGGAASTDTIGWDYRIDVPTPAAGDASTTGLALVRKAYNGGSSTFVSNRPFLFVGDPDDISGADNFGMSVTVPLADLGGDSGSLNYKVIATVYDNTAAGSSPDVGTTDVMPDLGDPPAAIEFTLRGTVRLQVEWDLSSVSVASYEDIAKATVTLTTEKGATDSEDTTFFSGFADQDGLLQPSDFEAAVSSLNGAVMQVPAGAPGQEGTFSFDVTSAVRTAIAQNFDFFSVQGRVNESQSGPLNGLQIRTTAPANVAANKAPKLDLVIDTQIVPMLSWEITSLPAHGTLKTLAGAPVTLNQTFSQPPTLVYTPNLGYSGPDGFNFQVAEGLTVDTASVFLTIINNDPCVINGREPGCAPSF